MSNDYVFWIYAMIILTNNSEAVSITGQGIDLIDGDNTGVTARV